MTDQLADAVLEQIRKGFDPERIDELIAKAVPEFIDEMAPLLAGHIKKDKKTLRANKRAERGFDRRLDKQWGKALDLYQITLFMCIELGESAAGRDSESLTPTEQNILEALTGLHVTACRVAGEILTLLSHGHPRGALARCRTLHETAVIAGLIAESATDAVHCDLAERFLDHEIVGRRRDALQFQKDHIALGEEPLEPEVLDEIERRYDEVIAKYGADFKRDYGWAKKFSPNDNFRELEEKASLSHVRPYYQWASSEVHCGARGLSHNFIEYRGITVRDVGKTNIGLIDPASMALSSLLQTTFALAAVKVSDGVDMDAILHMRAIQEIMSACGDALFEAQERIDRAEQDILKGMQKN
ncbi:DUF5677 domain-containing protein [Streptomyces sp. NPDC059224]|uniref:DUF5677 domain-containing protein n=1 Tax=Streptomyces sp. NPDC059224 TaxID=3346775 RepID=UPI0036AD250A